MFSMIILALLIDATILLSVVSAYFGAMWHYTLIKQIETTFDVIGHCRYLALYMFWYLKLFRRRKVDFEIAQ